MHGTLESIQAIGSNHCIANFRTRIPLKIHCAYMPHAGENKEQKQKDYNVLQEVLNSQTSCNQQYILIGDMNARLLNDNGLTHDNFGKNFLKKDNETSQGVLESRVMFIDL
eukprot:5671290-Karenia_brevis.AAC.1